MMVRIPDRLARSVLLKEALEYHDTQCCSPENPCIVRVRVAQVQASDGLARIDRAWDEAPSTERRQAADNYGTGPVSRVDSAATDPQLGLIRRLALEKDLTGLGLLHTERMTRIVEGGTTSFSLASNLIDVLIKLPRLSQAARPVTPNQADTIRRLAARLNTDLGDHLENMTFEVASALITKLSERLDDNPASANLTEGMYRTPDGTVYKVQVAHHGSGKLYAKRLVELSEHLNLENGTVRTHGFVKETGGLSKLTPTMKMTREEAQEWGRLYGTCCRCGIILTKESSIAQGMGDWCYNNY